MTLRKLLKIVSGLLIFMALAVVLTSINHPIILKWVTGAARHFGKPMAATVYTNGQVNNKIQVFYSDDGDNYLLSMKEHDSSRVQFFNINLDEKWIGRQVVTDQNNYDLIAGHLFLSENSQHFSPFEDHSKRSNFDPQFLYTDRQLQFNMPPNVLNFDSVRIKLP